MDRATHLSRDATMLNTLETKNLETNPPEELSTTTTEQTLLKENERTTEDPLDNASDIDDHVHYKTLKWWHCGILMIAECISLGILSLPHAMAVLGLLPYVACHARALCANRLPQRSCSHYRIGRHCRIHWLCDRAIQNQTSGMSQYGRCRNDLVWTCRARAVWLRPISRAYLHHGSTHHIIHDYDERPHQAFHVLHHLLLLWTRYQCDFDHA